MADIEKITEVVARKLAELDRNPWWKKLSDLDRQSYLSDAEVIISAIRSELERLPVLSDEELDQIGYPILPIGDRTGYRRVAQAQKADMLKRLGVEALPPSIGEVEKGSP